MELTVVCKPGPDGQDLRGDALLQKHLLAKLEKLEARWGKPMQARGMIEGIAIGYDCTITLNGPTELIGKAHGETPLKAVDAAMDKLTRRFETVTDKKNGKRRASGTVKAAF